MKTIPNRIADTYNRITTGRRYPGVNIREIWDYRLSSAVPCIDTTGGTWVAQVWRKENIPFDPANPEHTLATPLETYDTGIKTTLNDSKDCDKVSACYVWLITVRDKYSLPDIEERKPLVKKINQMNAQLAAIGAANHDD